jgi:uncharacterized membrane protein
MSTRSLPASFGWQWLPQTWSLFSKAPGKLLGLSLLSFAVFVGLSLIPTIGSALAGFAYPLIWAGLIRVSHEIDTDQPTSIGHAFFAFDLSALKPYFGLAVTSACINAATSVVGNVMSQMVKAHPNDIAVLLVPISIGAITLLILAAVLWMVSFFSPSLIYFQGLSSFRAMDESLRLTGHNWFALLVLGVVQGFVSVVATVPLFLGWIALAPMMAVLPYVMYREIFREIFQEAHNA